MRSTKLTSKKRAHSLSIAVCLALVLCAVLSFGFINYSGAKAAADDHKTANGIRFVQVAAGEDFAIGLTYDGKLYGWSLLEEPLSESNEANKSTIYDNSTLGNYYTKVPTQIKVVFRRGPTGSSGNAGWDDGDAYHGELGGGADRIKQIAATRTTALFVTENGYIYTWGRDTKTESPQTGTTKLENEEGVQFEESLNPTEHYLLLRDIKTSGAQNNWYEPYIINYDYYKNSAVQTLSFLKGSASQRVTDLSVAAGEYNYIALFQRGDKLYTYVWGSLMYSAVNATISNSGYNYTKDKFISLQGGAQARRVWEVSGSTAPIPVAGGYTVGINATSGTVSSGSTSLRLRGKNFITTAYDEDNHAIINTVATASPSDDRARLAMDVTAGTVYVDNAIIGGRSGDADLPTTNGIITTTAENGKKYYAEQKAPASAASGMIYTVKDSESVKNAQGKVLETAASSGGEGSTYADQYGEVRRFAVSLGNDIGYGISGGALYGWGDNAVGQIPGSGVGGNTDTPTMLVNGALAGKKFISVAAGKQLSAINKPFYDTRTVNLDGASFAGFGHVEGTFPVQNEADYITGAIGEDGKLYVWSNLRQTPEVITYGGEYSDVHNDWDKFTAVYSGYGNNLFAVTELGKMVRVTASAAGYDVERYDSFRVIESASGKVVDVVNWKVESTNHLEFSLMSAPTPEDPAPDLGEATVYVWNVAVSTYTDAGSSTVSNVTVNVKSGTDPTAFRPLVSSNDIGDVYRIYDGEDKYDRDFVSKTVDTATLKSFAPVFKFDGKVMTEAQQKNMFTYTPVRDENGVGIKIQPRTSTHGKIVTVEFYIARYNYNGAEKTGNTVDTLNGKDAVYYDFMPCSFTFTVADTKTVKTFADFADATGEDGAGKGNALVPLLDPNNTDNKYYTVTVQDVSTGVDELIKYLSGSSTVNTTLKRDIKTAMVAKDKGYPDRDKIARGNLEYYLGEEKAGDYYSDKYQFLYTDRDGDRVVPSTLASGVMSPLNSAAVNSVVGVIDHFDISVDFALALFPGLTEDEFDKKCEQLATDFRNMYGLYDISVEKRDEGQYRLTFKYWYLQFEAKKATGSVSFEGNDISKYQATSEKPSMAASMSLRTLTTYDTDYNQQDASLDSPNGKNVVHVFSSPGLRMKTKYNVDGHQLYGKNDGTNVYNETYAGTLYVGGEVTVSLSDYFEELGNDIIFSLCNRSDTQLSFVNYDAFNRTFTDETGNGKSVVELKNKTITLRPTTTEQIEFTVTIQRFPTSGQNIGFMLEGGEKFEYNEVIEAHFLFKNIEDFAFDITTSPTILPLITKTETVKLFGGTGSISDYAYLSLSSPNPTAEEQLKKEIKISEPKTSDPTGSIFTVKKSGSTDLIITPVSSGTGTILVIATVYGKSVRVSLTVNVSYVTNYPNTISVGSDSVYIYIDELKRVITEKNSFNTDIDKYGIIYKDVADPSAADTKKQYNAISYVDDSGNNIKPAYIDNIIFIGTNSEKPYIRIIPNNSSSESSCEVHIKFTDETYKEKYSEVSEGHILDVVLTVKSGKTLIQNGAVNINVRKSKDPSAWWSEEGEGIDKVVTFTLSDLLSQSGNVSDTPNWKAYLITSATTTSEFFNYSIDDSGKKITITPLYNTPEPCMINISAYGPDKEGKYGNHEYSFMVSVDGILSVLPLRSDEDSIGYVEIWLYSFIIVFSTLALIFIIRLIVYWKKRAKQRQIIKRNQELIRLRDRMHNKATAASREQVVKTKLKMEDPKYAKMFNEMRKDKENDTGVILENSDLAATANKKASKKKKKGGKKSVAELKAELEAKKAAFAAARNNGAQPVNPFAGGDMGMEGGFAQPMDGFAQPVDGFAQPMDGFGGPPPDGFDAPQPDFGGAQSIDGSEIVFDASDLGEGM